jgi:Cu(I)/Ag(I) efflux system membrane protein CusA/SilA
VINWLIEVSLRNRFLVIAFFILVAGWGYWALRTTPIDAIPDLSDNQVIVFTDWPGRSPQEVEDQITYPLTVSLQGLPGVRVVRSSSAFGFSMINVIFEDSVDLYFARSRVLERLNLLTKALPPGVVATLGPDATGVGHVFWYTVEGQGQSLRELRAIQDWYIRYQLNSVPGVAEVASVGGVVRQYQVDVDPKRLRAFKIPISAVVDAVMRSNRNVGGNVVEGSGTWSVVRGLGLIESAKDLEQVVIGADNGVPIFVRQVADVKVGDAFRVAALVQGGGEAVGGVVVARYGVSTVEVISRVKEKIAALQAGLPAGVRIVPFYDRSALIERAAATLKRSLIEEAVVVTLVNILFLLHLRSVLIVTIPIPLAVLIAFLFMRYLGITSNIMSLAGIAIAIGVLVDAAIVVTENAFRFIEKRRVDDPHDRRAIAATATRLLNELADRTPSVISVLLGAFSGDGPCFAGVTILKPGSGTFQAVRRPDPLTRGFRPGHIPKALLRRRYLAGAGLEAATVSRVDAAWIHGRDRDPRQEQLVGKRVVVLGCGSLGAPIAVKLAAAGVGRFALVDPQMMTGPNTSRHPLGARDVGESKAVA